MFLQYVYKFLLVLLECNDKFASQSLKLSIVLNCLENKLLWESIIFLSSVELLSTAGKHAISNK